MATINLYKTYSFRDKDPVIDKLRTIVKDAGVSYRDVENATNVSVSTLRGWFHGVTRRPQHSTVMAVARGLGYDYRLVKVSRGE